MTLATDQITRAKGLLSPPTEPHSALGTLAAAFLAATAAVLMASVVVVGPGFTLEDRPASDSNLAAG
jgi:hypothetical protein